MPLGLLLWIIWISLMFGDNAALHAATGRRSRFINRTKNHLGGKGDKFMKAPWFGLRMNPYGSKQSFFQPVNLDSLHQIPSKKLKGLARETFFNSVTNHLDPRNSQSRFIFPHILHQHFMKLTKPKRGAMSQLLSLVAVRQNDRPVLQNSRDFYEHPSAISSDAMMSFTFEGSGSRMGSSDYSGSSPAYQSIESSYTVNNDLNTPSHVAFTYSSQDSKPFQNYGAETLNGFNGFHMQNPSFGHYYGQNYPSFLNFVDTWPLPKLWTDLPPYSSFFGGNKQRFIQMNKLQNQVGSTKRRRVPDRAPLSRLRPFKYRPIHVVQSRHTYQRGRHHFGKTMYAPGYF